MLMAHEETGMFIPAKCEKTGKDFFVESYQAYDGTWVFAYGRASLCFGPRSDPSKKIQFSGVSGSGQG